MNNEIKEIKRPGQILDYVDTKEHLVELFNYITNLQQENEKIRKMNMYEHKYGSDMEEKYLIEKSRIEKAVEYIKEHTFQEEIGFDNKKGEIHYGYFVECKAKELLNILNGRSDE